MSSRSKGTPRVKSRASHDPNYETRIQEAIEARNNVEGPEYNWSWNKLAAKYNVAAQTLRDRATKRHGPMESAAKKRRLLDPAQEACVFEWAEQKAAEAAPWDKQGIRSFAAELTGKHVGKNWATRMARRHPDVLQAKQAKLDANAMQDESHPSTTILNMEFNDDTHDEDDRDYESPTHVVAEWEGSDVEDAHSPNRRTIRRASSPSETLEPADLIAHCYRNLAKMQHIPDEDKTREELIEDIIILRKQINALADALETQCARTAGASNTRKQTTHGITKVKRRFLTLPELRAAFEEEEKERRKKEQLAEEKEAQRHAEQREQDKRIKNDAENKVFDQPLLRYTKKGDLLAIALALKIQLPSKPTNSIIIEAIRGHLNQEPQLQSHPRFAGLYGHATGNRQNRQITTRNTEGNNFDSNIEDSEHTELDQIELARSGDESGPPVSSGNTSQYSSLTPICASSSHVPHSAQSSSYYSLHYPNYQLASHWSNPRY